MSGRPVRDTPRAGWSAGWRSLPFFLLLLTACGERAGEARLLLEDIAVGWAPSALKRLTPVPERRAVVWRVEGREGIGDLYLSPEGALARLVLVPGLTEQGPDDPRLVALAQSLARMRFAVLVPDLANLRRLQIDPEDARAIADAALAIGGLPAHGAAVSPVGLAAVSYSVGPALIAALEPDVAGRISFVAAIGGYYDMTTAVTFITTGHYRAGPGRPWQVGRPHGLAKWRFVAVNANRLGNPADRAILARIATLRSADPAAGIARLAAGLGADGRNLLALLENNNPDAVPGLIRALPISIRSGFDALSPSRRDLSALEARLILIHGRDDPAVPFTESMALAAAVPSGQAELYLIDGLDHVDFRAELGLSDQLTLLKAGQSLLAGRDRIAAGSTVGANR